MSVNIQKSLDVPLFIWAGGKRKMLKHYTHLLPSSIKSYCEPFFGGGAMFIHIMKHYHPNTVIVGDLNVGLISIYKAIQNDCDTFLQYATLLQDAYIPLQKHDRKEFYMKLRHKHAWEFEKLSSAEEAAILFFLLKTSFNGIYQINKNTNGRFGTPAGLLDHKCEVFNSDIVVNWNRMLQSVQLMATDWKETVNHLDDSFFTFCDPPYRGCYTSYGTSFDDNEQLKLVDWANRQSSVMLCNREIGDNFWEKNAGSLNVSHFDVTYTAGRRKRNDDGSHSAKKATEVLLWRK